MDRKQLQEISVRKAQPEDAEAICHVHFASVRTLCVNDYTPEQIEAWVGNLTPEGHRNAIEKKSEIMFVADKKGIITGFYSLFDNEVRAVYVHPDYVHQGVGKLLLEAVEKEAVYQHIEKLQLSASTNAQSFYQACGYKVVEHSFHTLRSGVQIPCVYMEKFLIKTDAH